MGTMVEAQLPADQFALSETLSKFPTTEFEILRVVADGSDRPIPFVWMAGEDIPAVLDALEDDPSVQNVEVMAELEDECMLWMEWVAHIHVILYILIEEDATIIGAVGKENTWRLKIFFPKHESVSTTYDFCEEQGIDLEFERIYQLTDSLRRVEYGLSENQYEALRRAYEKDYYSIPREVNLQELAEELGVSHQALSECLRRGHQTLIENTLRPEFERTDELVMN